MIQENETDLNVFPMDRLKAHQRLGLPVDEELLGQWVVETKAAYEMAHPSVRLHPESIERAFREVLGSIPQIF